MDNDVFRSAIYLDPRFKVNQNYYFPSRAEHNKNFFFLLGDSIYR
jgi:hypothetical protein